MTCFLKNPFLLQCIVFQCWKAPLSRQLIIIFHTNVQLNKASQLFVPGFPELSLEIVNMLGLTLPLSTRFLLKKQPEQPAAIECCALSRQWYPPPLQPCRLTIVFWGIVCWSVWTGQKCSCWGLNIHGALRLNIVILYYLYAHMVTCCSQCVLSPAFTMQQLHLFRQH